MKRGGPTRQCSRDASGPRYVGNLDMSLPIRDNYFILYFAPKLYLELVNILYFGHFTMTADRLELIAHPRYDMR
jgi:hypothetical protein